MKHRIIPILMASIILAGSSVPAYAAEMPSVSMSSPQEGVTYAPKSYGDFIYADSSENSNEVWIFAVTNKTAKSITIPDKINGKVVTGIYQGSDPSGETEYSLFAGNTNLESVTIPDTVTYIASNAFEGCTKLKELKLPSSLKGVYPGLCKGCTSLESIFIPSTISSIASNAFDNCPNLKTIKTDGDSQAIQKYVSNHPGITIVGGSTQSTDSDKTPVVTPTTDTDSKTQDGSYSVLYYGIYKYVIKDSAITIVNINADDAEEVKIPAQINGTTVKELRKGQGGSSEMNLFTDNTTIQSVVIPDTITYIDPAAFSGCTNLKSVTMSKNIQQIQAETFKNCKALKSITLPDTVTYISGTAFENCDIKIYHSTKCKAINDYLKNHPEQDGNPVETDATDSDTTTTLQPNTPYDYGNFTYMLNDDGKTIAIIDVKSTNDSKIVIPPEINGHKVTEINEATSDEGKMYPFKNNKTVKEIVIPNSVSYIAPGTFENCTNLETVNWPSGTTKILNDMFKNCTSLKPMTLPSTITIISDTAFEDCPKTFKIIHNGTNQGITKYLSNHQEYDGLITNAGDIDGDDMITSSDALRVLRASVGLEKLTSDQTSRADMDSDNAITSADALIILRMSINL